MLEKQVLAKPLLLNININNQIMLDIPTKQQWDYLKMC
jgi:hypothetical protein